MTTKAAHDTRCGPPLTSSVDPQDSPYRFVVAGLVLLLKASFGLSFFVVGPIAPHIIEEYDISYSEAGLLTGLTLLATTLALPCSMLVGRVPLKVLIALGWFLAASPALTLLAFDYPVLLATRIMFGASIAILLPSLGPLLMYWFRPSELPLVNGLSQASITLAMALSTFVAAPMSEAIGWKAALSVFGFFNLAGALAWMTLGRVGQSAKSPVRGLSLGHAWRVMKSRPALLLAAADAGPVAQYTVLVAWLPAFYFEVHGISLVQAGSMLSLLPLAGFVALIAVGLISVRVQRRRPFLLIPGIMVGFAGFGSFLLADSSLVYVPLLLLGVASWLYVPVLLTVPMELPRMSPEQVSLMWAAIMTVGGTLTFIAPLAAGALTDLTGSYLPGFSLFAVLAWSLAVAGSRLPETRPRRRGAIRLIPAPVDDDDDDDGP